MGLDLRLEPVAASAYLAARLVESARPNPLRTYDQIPMRTADLAKQASFIMPRLAGQSVAFVGDMDGAAPLLGLLAASNASCPARMLVLDFDERVVDFCRRLAEEHAFTHLLDARLYNCFDPLPNDLVGQFDWFYTNPPYGSQNRGESARLFITRGCELVRSDGGSGCLIAPDDARRPWTREAMMATTKFLANHGWAVREKIDNFHRYHLDDDPDLPSSVAILDRISFAGCSPMPLAGRAVDQTEIPCFYGRSTTLPYPRFIDRNGVPRSVVIAA